MKKWFLILAAVLVLFARPDQAKACEPCAEMLSLEETAAQADLIIVGRLVEEGPSTGEGEVWGGPDWIEIQVVEAYKGQPSGEQVRVNSWDGMCPYGIILNDQDDHLIFLKQTEDGYDAVNFGCAVKHLLVEEGRVIIGDMALPIADLTADLGLGHQENLIEQTEIETEPPEDQNNSSGPQLCALPGVGLILAAVMAVLWVGKKKALTPGEDANFP